MFMILKLHADTKSTADITVFWRLKVAYFNAGKMMILLSYGTR